MSMNRRESDTRQNPQPLDSSGIADLLKCQRQGRLVLAALRERFGPTATTPPAVSVALPAIDTYDALLGAGPTEAAA
jgi:hypothetical protein